MSKKVLLLVVVLLVAMITNMLASESRIMALGNAQGFVRDNTDVFKYPGSIFKYVKNADVELRTQGFENNWSIGVNLPMYKNVLGVYLNRPTNIDVNWYLNHSDYSYGDLDITKKIQFLYGFGNIFAAGFGMAMDSNVEPLTSKKNLTMTAMYMEFTGGMSTEKIDVGAFLNIPVAAVENEVSKEKEAFGGVGIGVNGRYFVSEAPKLTTMALADLELHGLGNEIKQGSTTLKYSNGDFLFDFGVGANYKVDDKNNLIMGLYPLKIVSYSETTPNATDSDKEDTYSESYIYIPEYKIAFETQLASWLTGRVGACQDFYFYGESDKVNGQDEINASSYGSSFNAELGFGIQFKRFTIDGVLIDALLFDGPDFVGGTGPGMTSKLSIGYDFN